MSAENSGYQPGSLPSLSPLGGRGALSTTEDHPGVPGREHLRVMEDHRDMSPALWWPCIPRGRLWMAGVAAQASGYKVCP